MPDEIPKRKRAVPRVAQYLNTDGGANPADSKGVNINTLVAQYKKTGTLPNVGLANPLYGDFTFPDDIHSMREAVYAAEERFNQLPADVRSAADNDWVRFVEMFNDPAEQALLETAGLQITDKPVIPNNSPPPESSPSAPPDPDPIPATPSEPPPEPPSS